MWKRRRLLSIGLAAAASACVTSRPSGVIAKPRLPVFTLPFRYDYGRRMIVPVYIDGKGPFDFVLDTAATTSVAFANLADRVGAASVQEPPERVMGLSGVRDAPIHHFGEIRAGAAVTPRMTMPVLEDWHEMTRTPQGILGLDVLNQYEFVFNHERAEIRFYNGPAPERSQWRQVDLQPLAFNAFSEKHLYLMKGELSNGIVVPLIIDLGSSISLLNFSATQDLVTLPPNIGRQVQDYKDIHGGSVPVFELRVGGFEVSSERFSDQLFLVSNAPFFEQIDYADSPVGLLGLDFFRRRNFAFDLANNRIYFPPTPA